VWDDSQDCNECLPCITSERLKDTYTADKWPQPGKGPKAGPHVGTMDDNAYKVKRPKMDMDLGSAGMNAAGTNSRYPMRSTCVMTARITSK